MVKKLEPIHDQCIGNLKNNAVWFQPDIDDAVEKLQYAYQNYEKLNADIDKQRSGVYTKYSWQAVTSQFLDLCK